jgi:hypothetical protein
MRVLLCSPDSKLPNLALMKISTYHKRKGDIVGLHTEKPDLIYISVLFKNTRLVYDKNIPVIIGGPGYNETVKLPPEIEKEKPDHSLYGSKYAIGRVTSGCIRHCYFCCVPKLEPNGIRFIQKPDDIWIPNTVLRLLDDNILADEKAFNMVYAFCLKNDVTVRFEYLDFRLINIKNARMLKLMKHEYNRMYFSWDILGDEKKIINGIRILNSVGIGSYRLRVLMYIHSYDDIDSVKYRWKILREYGCEPFLMVNPNNKDDRITKIARKCCRLSWRNMTIEQIFDPNY